MKPFIERPHLATLAEDMRAWGGHAEAVVEHRGVRRYSTSYGELATLAHRFAAELERRGIAPGARVLLWGANSAPWIAAFFGCVLRGVLPVPLDATGTVTFAERIAREVSPRLIVGDRLLLKRLSDAAPTLQIDTLPFESLHQALPEEVGDAKLPVLTPDSPLQILFTSGTTGKPKGVVQTHRNLLASLLPIEREIWKYRRYERWVHPLRFLHTLPLSHVFGQFMGLWVPPLLGAAVHYESRATGSRLAALIPRERINVLAAVPRTLALLRAHLLVDTPQLALEIAEAQGEPVAKRWWRFRHVHRALGLRFWAMVCGGATLPAELEQFWTTLGFALVQGYGLTETAALVTLNHPFKTAHGSLGTPLPGRSLRLSATGELEVKGEMVSTASWRNGRMVPRAPSANLPDHVSGTDVWPALDDGAQPPTDTGLWLPTGDLAAIDADGRIRFLGRTGQRLVTTAGLNVYLQDVEQVLARQPEISEAVVLVLPGDQESSEEAGAVIVAHGGGNTASAAVARANSELATHQQVHRWWLWPGLALPRTATGKVQRKMVETWAHRQAAVSKQPWFGQPQEKDASVTLLESLGGRGSNASDSARLDRDWGLDSMGHVALAAALEEQLGFAMHDGAAAQLQTLGDLRALLGFQGPGPVAGTGAEGEATPAHVVEKGAANSIPIETGALEDAALRGRTEDGTANKAAPRTPKKAPKQPRKTPGQLVSPSAKEEHAPAAHARQAPAQAPRYRYPTWPWMAPVAGLRMLFREVVLRPLVALLAAPRVLAAASMPNAAYTLTAATLNNKDPAFSFHTSRPMPHRPMLLISNHRTAMDVPLLLYALPFALRRVAVGMSGEMLAGWQGSWSWRPLPPALAPHRRWWGPPVAFLLQALLNVFPLPRTSGFRGSFAHAGRALDRGYSVLIFPEGRRASDEVMLPFKPGLGVLAQEAGVPVLPLALSIAPGSGRWLRSHPTVHIGQPVEIDPEIDPAMYPAMTPEKLTMQFQLAVAALLIVD